MIPVEGIIKGATSPWDAIFGSKRRREANRHVQIQAGLGLDTATLGRFAAKFQAADRSWWDAFVNGLNRLPRPLFALGVLAVVFVWPAWDLPSFVRHTQGLAAVPEGFWALVTVIVGFYLGGRMRRKSQRFKQTGGPAARATALLQARAAKTRRKRAKPWIDPDPRTVMGVE